MSITINKLGAELTSIIANKQEYIWQADSTFWGRHAPNLFPIIGKLKDDCYQYQGKKYHMSQHGFARDMKFKIIEQTKKHVVLRLKENENTLKLYPFHFFFDVSFTLKERELIVNYTVTNTSDKDKLLFSVGGHPGFNLPLDKNSKLEDYKINIKTDGSLANIPVELPDVLTKFDNKTVVNSKEILLSNHLFDKGVLIFETNSQTNLILLDKQNKPVISVSSENMNYFGVWSTNPHADFICLEPWWGIADDVSTSGNLEEKRGIMSLLSNEVFEAQYKIKI